MIKVKKMLGKNKAFIGKGINFFAPMLHLGIAFDWMPPRNPVRNLNWNRYLIVIIYNKVVNYTRFFLITIQIPKYSTLILILDKKEAVLKLSANNTAYNKFTLS